MKTLNWRHTDWLARNFIFTMGQQIIGELTFHSSWDSNASYTDNETKIRFSQKNFWDRDVVITRDGKAIGEIHSEFFGEKKLKLVTGESYILWTSFWEQEVYWRNEQGEVIIMYQQATMSSMGKGSINLKDTLTIETEKLLISSGLFIRRLTQKRIALIAAVGIPIMAAASRS